MPSSAPLLRIYFSRCQSPARERFASDGLNGSSPNKRRLLMKYRNDVGVGSDQLACDRRSPIRSAQVD